ncbi:MAG: HEAT repeat domain-containing protein [Planctomycetota bacterium]|nr:HEAT repeat domain-containing protein [Planctomycetota bacterium]
MSYAPPPPGTTEVGKPTPGDVPKQAVEIRDLPPEARRNFLMAMVFFPTLVGASICLVLFLGWWLLRDAKSPERYVAELRAGVNDGSRRTRWAVARELAENISDKRLHTPEILGALLELVEKPELDEEVEPWSPSTMIRNEDEKQPRLRWYAAYFAGHLAGILDDKHGTEVLLKALEETQAGDPRSAAGMRYYAAAGLGLAKHAAAVPGLQKHLLDDPDAGVRAICAKSLGAIGEFLYFREGAAPGDPENLEALREALRRAFQKDKDVDVGYNAAIALARLRDETGRAALESLAQSEDAQHQRMAKQALALIEKK